MGTVCGRPRLFLTSGDKSTLDTTIVWTAVLGALALAVVFFVNARRPGVGLLLVFTVVCFFPEYSQTEWNIWSADDFRSLYNYRPVTFITASVFDYLFLVLCLGWLIGLLRGKKLRPSVLPYKWPFFCYLGMVIIGLAHGFIARTETYYALREFREMIYFAILAFVIVAVGDLHLVERWTQFAVGLACIRGVEGVGRFWLGIGKEYYGYRTVYYDPGESWLFTIFVLLVVGWVVSTHGVFRGPRKLLLLFLPPVALSFVLSFRRSAWVGLLGALFFSALYMRGRQRLKVAFSMVGLAIVLFWALMNWSQVFPDQVQLVLDRVKSVVDTEEDTSNTFRIVDAKNAFEAIVRSPLLGVGLGGRYELIHRPDGAADFRFMMHVSRTSHNGYLFLAMKLGAPALLFFLAIAVAFVRSAWHLRDQAPGTFPRGTLCGLVLTIVAYLVGNITGPMLDTIRGSILFAFVLGMGTIILKEAKRHAQAAAGEQLGVPSFAPSRFATAAAVGAPAHAPVTARQTPEEDRRDVRRAGGPGKRYVQ